MRTTFIYYAALRLLSVVFLQSVLDTVLIYICLGNGRSIESLLIHDDCLLGDCLACFNLLDDIVDIGSLERIALSIIVPVLVQ